MAELVLDNLDLELVQQGWGCPKNASGKKALNRYLTTYLIARLYWSGQLLPETVAFEFFYHGANRDVFQGVSDMAGALVIKMLVLGCGEGSDSNSAEVHLIRTGMRPFAVKVWGLFTKALGNHGYSCLVEAKAYTTMNDALLACVNVPCTAASLEVALRTLWCVAYLLCDLHRAGFNCQDAGPWNLGLNNCAPQRASVLDWEHVTQGQMKRSKTNQAWNASVGVLCTAMTRSESWKIVQD